MTVNKCSVCGCDAVVRGSDSPDAQGGADFCFDCYADFIRDYGVNYYKYIFHY